MKLLDRFRKKEDPEVAAAERRAFEKEREIVNREKKQKAIQAAGERGRSKARGTSTSSTSSKVIGDASKLGTGIMTIGNYGASLNWGGEAPAPSQRTISSGKRKGNKSKKVRREKSFEEQYGIPEFPF
jgi:hypothetical protein